MCEEIFGPVLTIYVYNANKFEETLTLVDETSPYALTGAVFSQAAVHEYALHEFSEPAVCTRAGDGAASKAGKLPIQASSGATIPSATERTCDRYWVASGLRKSGLKDDERR